MDLTPVGRASARQLPSPAAVQTSARASLVWCPHPLLPDSGRIVAFDPPTGMESLHAYLTRCGVDLSGPVIVSVDTTVVPRAWLTRVRPKPGTLITVRAAVADGGGGSQVLAVVAMIALSMAAPYLGAYIGSMGSAFVAGTDAACAASTYTAISAVSTIGQGVVTLAGAMAISALTPRPKSNLGAALGGSGASATYSISGGSNKARPYEPLGLTLGTHRVFLDLASRPYAVFEGDQQYLYQVFHVGLVGPYGPPSIADLRIGETLLSDYSGVETEFTVGSMPVMMPYNVDSIAGAAVTVADGPVLRTTSIDTTRIEADFTWSIYQLADSGPQTKTCTFALEYRAVGAAVWIPADGTSAQITVSSGSATPLRHTYSIPVTSGQYEVRCTRISIDETDSRQVSVMTWGTLKSYQSQAGNFSGQAFLAVKILATGQLSGTIATLSALITLPSIAAGPSSNVADIYLLWARGYRDAAGRLMWGAGLADGDIDLSALAAWRTYCAAKGLTFNAQLDSSKSVWDMLQAIARCGRGSPSWASGKLGVIWDAAAQPVVAVFGPSNIKRGSFEVSYPSEIVTDEITLTYVDAANSYSTETVRAPLASATAPLSPSTTELWGCTDRGQAQREANLMLAQNSYRVRTVSWLTDMEGLVVTRGDVVMLSHDLTQWGYSGRLVAGSTTVLQLDRPVTLTPAGTWVTIVHPDGTQTTHRVSYQAGSVDGVTLLDPLASAPDADSPYDWRYLLDYLPTPGKRVKIIAVKPSSMHEVSITAMDDPDEYYAAEGGTYTLIAPRMWTSDVPELSALAFSEQTLRAAGSYSLTLTATWSETGIIARRAVTYSINGGPPAQLSADSSSATFPISDAGYVDVTVIAYDNNGNTRSEAIVTARHNIVGPKDTVTSVTGLALAQPFTGPTCYITWDAGKDTRSYTVEVWAAGAKRRTVADITTTTFAYAIDTSRADGGPFRALEFRVAARLIDGSLGAPAVLTATNPQCAAPSGIAIVPAGGSLSVSCNKNTDPDYAGARIWISATAGFNPLATAPDYDGPNNWFSRLALTAGTYYVRVAQYDAFGIDSLIVSSEFSTAVTGAGGVIHVTAMPANPAAIGGELAFFLDVTDPAQRGIWGWDGTTWKFTRDGANLIANSIAADRLYVANLAAISANMGALTSGSITLDAAGFLRGGQTAYNTGNGFWIGYNGGAYKMSVGPPTGAGYTWDGVNFTIRGLDGTPILTTNGGIPASAISGLAGASSNLLYNTAKLASNGDDAGWVCNYTDTLNTTIYYGSDTSGGAHSLTGSLSRYTRLLNLLPSAYAEWASSPQKIQVAPGDRLEAYALLGTSGADGEVGIVFCDAAGSQLSTGGYAEVGLVKSAGASGGTTLSSWGAKVGGFATAPAGAAQAFMRVRHTQGAGGAEDSAGRHAVAAIGSPIVYATGGPYGDGYTYLDGAGSWFNIASAISDFQFSTTDDFTIRVAVRLRRLDANIYDYAGAHQFFVSASGALEVWTAVGGRLGGTANGVIQVRSNADAWQIIEWSRSAGTSRLMVDGQVVATWADTWAYTYSPAAPYLTVGSMRYTAGYQTRDVQGDIAYFVIGKGLAVHTGNHSPVKPTLDVGHDVLFTTLSGESPATDSTLWHTRAYLGYATPGQTALSPWAEGSNSGATAAAAKAAADAATAAGNAGTAAATALAAAQANVVWSRVTARSGLAALVSITNANVASALALKVIGGAYIDDLAVGTAQIGDLAVSTLKIQGNAVTIPYLISSSVRFDGAAGATWYDYAPLIMPTAIYNSCLGHTSINWSAMVMCYAPGGDMWVRISKQITYGGSTGEWTVVGATLAGHTSVQVNSGAIGFSASAVFDDYNANSGGCYIKYKMEVMAYGWTPTILGGSIEITECKR